MCGLNKLFSKPLNLAGDQTKKPVWRDQLNPFQLNLQNRFEPTITLLRWQSSSTSLEEHAWGPSGGTTRMVVLPDG
jgi:hypothetical protein